MASHHISVLEITIPPELIQQEVKHYGLGSMNSLIIFGIGKNCLSSGKSLLLYQYKIRVMKPTVAIIETISYKTVSNILVSRLSP
jgi:hypothetical protein